MKTPKFTDTARYPNGYRHAKNTDISKTFARERKRLAEAESQRAEAEKETAQKVRKLEKAK